MHPETYRLESSIHEYRSLVSSRHFDSSGDSDLTMLQTALQMDADWTPEAANILVDLATQYGSFVLRNACALAVAMGVEDGSKGF